ncbi:MAG: IS982 family transposase [Phototrophicaceae bacterium]
MNDTYIITAYCVIEDILKASNCQDDVRTKISAAEILLVAVVSAKYFQNHHERALCILIRLGEIPRLSVSRFNRRLHALSGWLHNIVSLLGDIFAHGEAFIIDSMPLPVCKRARARRCKKVRGKAYCGYCAAKKEKFFGWRLHLICDEDGIPVAFDLLPASEHDLTPLHELTANLPQGASVFGDKGYISAEDAQSILDELGVRIVSIPRKNMPANSWADEYDMRLYRKRIETVYSQLESMGVQRLHARTNIGFDMKAWASLLALAFTNIMN